MFAFVAFVVIGKEKTINTGTCLFHINQLNLGAIVSTNANAISIEFGTETSAASTKTFIGFKMTFEKGFLNSLIFKTENSKY